MTVCDALSTANGTSVILPGAVTPQKNSNDENTQLYPVHPFRLFGVGKPNLALAVLRPAHAGARWTRPAAERLFCTD